MIDYNGMKIYWQAHRGGGSHEAPDNTIAADRFAWNLGGIPENDIRQTKDGTIICLHDATLGRTTNAPADIRDQDISSLEFSEVRKWDAGIKFDGKYKGEKVPSLEDVFSEMTGKPDRLIYLDLKNIDLKKLGSLINKYGVSRQVIFTHNVRENCMIMKQITEDVKTMLWIGGNRDEIIKTFEKAYKSDFQGLDQVQIHLNLKDKDRISAAGWIYDIDKEFLKYAIGITSDYDLDFEVLPFYFEKKRILDLVGMGIRWFATDEPARFISSFN